MPAGGDWSISFSNRTELEDERLRRLCVNAVCCWRVRGVTVRVRYSRGADFSGTCFYADRRIYVNLGRHLAYPYRLATHLARARSHAGSWWKPTYNLVLRNGYQVVLFVFLHEFYHLLVKRARRNTRQKESMCDRFAARHLVDWHGVAVGDEHGAAVRRADWDFQDLDGFVRPAAQRRARHRQSLRAARSAARVATGDSVGDSGGTQLLLFEPLRRFANNAYTN